MADEEAEGPRDTEIFTLQAIFPELIFKPEDKYTASISIPVSPAKPILVTFAPPSDITTHAPLPTPPLSNDKGKGRDNGEGSSQRAPIFTIVNNEIVRAPPTPKPEGKGKEVVQETPSGAPVDGPEQTVPEVYKLSHFPPLLLDFTLPEGYPENEPPIIKVSTAPAWLSENTLQVLEKQCEQLWKDLGREPVMFTYIDNLKEAVDINFFDQMRSTQKGKLLVEQSKDNGGIDLYGPGMGKDSPLHVPQGVMIALLEFDTNAKRKEFERQTFDCGVCLEPKKGSLCYRMIACRHVFCVECLQEYYNKLIQEGELNAVRCADPTCGKNKKEDETKQESSAGQKRRKKDDRTLSPNELLQIPISVEIVDRYIDQKRKAELAADKKTVYCPRKWCQGAARSRKHPKPSASNAGEPEADSSSDEDEDEDENKDEGKAEAEEAAPVSPKTAKSPNPFYADRLCICEDCSYAFCKVCRAGWHGDWVYCAPRDPTELTEEEKASMAYMRDHSQPCPTCQTRIQKTDGCNKMTCSKCRTYFCYLCGAWLMPHQPYRHFNTADSSCFGRLWDLEEGDGAPEDGEEMREDHGEEHLAVAFAGAAL